MGDPLLRQLLGMTKLAQEGSDALGAEVIGLAGKYRAEAREQVNFLGTTVDAMDYRTITSIMAKQIEAGGEPDALSSRWAAAAQLSQMQGTDIGEAYLGLDKEMQKWYGRPFSGSTDLLSIQQSAQLGIYNTELGKAYFAMRLFGGRDKAPPALVKTVENLEKLVEPLAASIKSVPRHLLVDLLNVGVQSLPYTLEALAGGAAMGSAIKGAVAEGAPGLSGAIVALQALGAKAGSWAASSTTMAGLEYGKLIAAGVRHEIAAPISDMGGAIQGAIEVLLGEVPGILGGVVGKGALPTITGKVLQRLSLTGTFGRVAKIVMGAGGQLIEEAIEEGFQELDSAANLALAAVLQGEGVQKETAREVARNVLTASVEGFKAALLLGIPGSIIQYRGTAKEAADISAQAKRTDKPAFIEQVAKQEPSIIAGMTEKQGAEVLDAIWEAAQTQKAKEVATTKAAEEKAAAEKAKTEAERTPEVVQKEIEAKEREAAGINPAEDTEGALRAEAELGRLREEFQRKKEAKSVAPKPAELTRAEWLKTPEGQAQEKARVEREKEAPSASQEQGPMGVARVEPPGPSAQVAEGGPEEAEQAPGARPQEEVGRRELEDYVEPISRSRINEIKSTPVRAAIQYITDRRDQERKEGKELTTEWTIPSSVAKEILEEQGVTEMTAGATFIDTTAGQLTISAQDGGKVYVAKYNPVSEAAWRAMTRIDQARAERAGGRPVFAEEKEPAAPPPREAPPAEEQGVGTTIWARDSEGTRWEYRRVDPNTIALAPEIPQQKGVGVYGSRQTVIDKKTGTVTVAGQSQKIVGIDPGVMPPIQVMERLGGELELVTGRHRLEALIREGHHEVVVQVARESEGFTPEAGRFFDIIANLRDGKLSLADAVDFYLDSGISEEDARARGLIPPGLGEDAWVLAHSATPGLRDLLFPPERSAEAILSRRQALAIATAAPGNEAVQLVAGAYAASLKDTREGIDDLQDFTVQTAKDLTPEDAQQGSLLEGEENYERLKEEGIKTHQAGLAHRRALTKERTAVAAALSTIAGKKAEQLKKGDYKMSGDEIKLRRRLSELDPEIRSWGKGWLGETWHRRFARETAGLTVKDLTADEREEMEAYWRSIRGGNGPTEGEAEGGADLFDAAGGFADVTAGYDSAFVARAGDAMAEYTLAMAAMELPKLSAKFLADSAEVNAYIIKTWGETKDPKKASWILTDGRMSSYSAKAQKELETRSPHKAGLNAEGVAQFMVRTGAIRLDSKEGIVELVARPTEEQIVAITEAFRRRREIRIQYSTREGQEIASADIGHPTEGKLRRLTGIDEMEYTQSEEKAGGGPNVLADAEQSERLVAQAGARADDLGRGRPLSWESRPGESPVAGEWKANHRVDFQGQTVQSVKALAELVSILRNPRMELFQAIFTDSADPGRPGAILHNNAMTSLSARGVNPFSSRNLRKSIYDLQGQVQRAGAAGLWFVHNHPGGLVVPSGPDVRSTAAIAKAIPQLQGHIILDGDKFTLIHRDGRVEERTYEGQATFVDPAEELSTRPTVESDQRLANVAKRLAMSGTETAVLVINTQARVLSWDLIHNPERLSASRIHQIVRERGGPYAMVVTGDRQIFELLADRFAEEQRERNGKEFDVRDMLLVDSKARYAVASALGQGRFVDAAKWGHDVYRARRHRGGIMLWTPTEPYQAGLFPDIHRQAVINAVLTGEWVPDNVLDDYRQEIWAQHEIMARQNFREDAVAWRDAGAFMDADMYAETMALADPLARSRDYYRNVWNTAEENADPARSAQRFLVAFSKSYADVSLHDLGDDSLFDAIQDGETVAELQAQLEALPEAVKAAINEVRIHGSMQNETYARMMVEIRKDPNTYRFLLGGMAATLDATTKLRQATAEADVDPREAEIEDLRKAYELTAGKYAELQQTVGEILDHSRELSRQALRGQLDLEKMRAGFAAQRYIERLVKLINRPVSAMIALPRARAIIAIQKAFVSRGARTVVAIQQKIQAILKANPSQVVSRAAESLMKVRILDQMSLKELEALAAQVKGLRDMGREEWAEVVAQKHEKWSRMRQGALANIRVARGHDSPIIRESLEDIKRKRGGGWENMFWFTLRPDRFAQILDNGERGFNYHLIVTGENQAQDAESRNVDRRNSAFAAKFEELGLKPSDFNSRIFTTDEGQFTLGDCLGIYLLMQNEDSAAAVEYGNFKKSASAQEHIGAMIDRLSPQMKALGDWMLESFQGNDKTRLLSFVEEHFNRAFVEVEKYFPMMRQGIIREIAADQIAEDLLGRPGATSSFYPAKGFTKPRQKINKANQTEIKLNAIALYYDAIAKQEHLLAWQEQMENMRAVYGNREVQLAIRDKWGGAALRVFLDHIKRVANPDSIHYADSPVDHYFRSLRSKVQMSALSWNLAVWGRNHPLVGSWLYLRDAGPTYLIRAQTKLYTQRKELEAFVYERDPQVKDRVAHPLFWQLRQQDQLGYRTILSRVGWYGLRVLEHWDRQTVLTGWIACYDMMMAQRNPDGTHKYSEWDAIQYAQHATIQTQPTGYAKDLSAFLDSTWGKNLCLFGNQLSNMLNMMVFDLPQDIRHKRIDRVLGMVVGFTMTGLLMGIVQRKRPPEDLKEAALDVASQFLSPTIVGDEVLQYFTGRSYYGGGTLWSGMIRDSVKAVRVMFDSDAELQDRILAVLQAGAEATRLIGAPAVALDRLARATFKGDLWELAGGREPKSGE